MSKVRRLLLLTEVSIFFGPSMLYLLLGLLMSPMLVPSQIFALAHDPLHWEASFQVLGALCGGVIGTGAVWSLVKKLLSGERIGDPAALLIGLACGVIATFLLGLHEGWSLLLLQILPLIGTAHLLFLGRRSFATALSRSSQRTVLNRTWMLVPLSLVVAAVAFAAHTCQSERELIEHRAHWESQRPTAYSYSSRYQGWQHARTQGLPRRIHVRDSRVVSAEYRFNGVEAHEPPAKQHAWTIDDLFDEVLAAKRRGARIKARFNNDWGYIEAAEVLPDDTEAEWMVEVQEFQAEQ